jgi:putative toxin-antitoxin system antitoxin component (TIGR02293 family)
MAERQHTEHAPKKHLKGAKGAHAKERMRRPYERDTLASPIEVAAGALILGKVFGGGSAPSPGTAAPRPSTAPAGDILGGLGDLIGKLTAGGAGQQVGSWVGSGANQPIQPGQLGSALGPKVIDDLAARSGMSKEELLNQLATVLPQLINHLTPSGRVPTLAELEKAGTDSRSVVSRVATSGVTAAVHKTGSGGAGHFEAVSSLLGGRKVLGSMIDSDLEAHELLHRGLPRGALTSLIGKLHDIPVIEVSEALGMSLRTLQRHKATPVARLDVQQSGRAWKFAEILAKATRVLGSQDEAEQWLKRPAIGLDQRPPLDLLTTPAGVKLVEDYLGRLEYGVYT